MIFVFSFCKNLLGDRKFGALSLLIAALLIFAPAQARAHAKMLRSQPANGETLRQAPKFVELEFNQKLQTAGANSVFVMDQTGKRVDINAVVVSEDEKKLRIELEDLGSGTYSVEWKALSADEHLIKGGFVFNVALSDGEPKAGAPAIQNDFQNNAAFPPVQESGTNWMQTAARWLTHLTMTLLFGGFAFLLLVLKPSLFSSPDLSGETRATAFKRGKNLFASLAWLNLALLSVSAFAALILQTSVMYGLSVANAAAPANLLRTVSETNFGESWLLQAVLTALLLPIVFLIDRKSRRNASLTPEANEKTFILWLGLAVCALLFLAPSLSGHARAAARDYSLAIVSQWLHLIAVGVWVGGLFYLAVILPRCVKNFDSRRRLSITTQAIGRFSRYAVAFSILLAVSGVYSSVIHVKDFSDLWTSFYGLVLTAKIAVFLLMLALGGLNSFVFKPRLQNFTETPDSKNGVSQWSNYFYRSVGAEIGLGAIALLLAAALAFAPLGHQH